MNHEMMFRQEISSRKQVFKKLMMVNNDVLQKDGHTSCKDGRKHNIHYLQQQH
jgi:hypothetical protein